MKKNAGKSFLEQNQQKPWIDWVSSLSSKQRFYHRLQVDEKCLKRCLTTWFVYLIQREAPFWMGEKPELNATAFNIYVSIFYCKYFPVKTEKHPEKHDARLSAIYTLFTSFKALQFFLFSSDSQYNKLINIIQLKTWFYLL